MEYGDTIESTVSPTRHGNTTRTPSLCQYEDLCDTCDTIYGDVSREATISSLDTQSTDRSGD